MQAQFESKTFATPQVSPVSDTAEVLSGRMDADQMPATTAVVRPGDAPGETPITTKFGVPEDPEPLAVAAPMPPVPEQICQAIQHLVHVLPDKPAAVGLENGQIGIVMRLDPETRPLIVPFLETHCNFQPYVPPAVDAGPSLNAHLLIVDDAHISRLVLRRLIEQLPGCAVTEAANGAEALELLRKGLNPDLVVCDICMPTMDGFQLLSRIRSATDLAGLEVVICSVATDRDSVVRAAELNVTKYLVKPFQPQEVRAQLRDMLIHISARATTQIQSLKDRLGLSSTTCGELFQQIAEQIREEIRTVRNELGRCNAHAAALTLERLRGSCALIKDPDLITRVQTVLDATTRNDMFAIVKGLEVLEAEGKRLDALAAKLRKHSEPGEKRPDPLAAAARRASSA